MKYRAPITRAALTVLLCAVMSGCFPASQSQFEEEKESHFLAGKNCVNSMDYGGAIEAFEKAVEINPQSASAHFQLGWLYEEKEKDPAAAIYHYRRFLKLRPNTDNAEVVKQRIVNCKQDLAKDVLPLPVAPAMQRELEKIAEENKNLRTENEQLKALVIALKQQAATNPAPASARIAAAGNDQRVLPATNRQVAPAARTYVIRAGDTAVSIARKHGVKLDALLNANPGIDPRRLRVGKTLNIP